MDYKKILIAVDDGPVAEKVVMDGFRLVQQLNAEAALISVVDTTFLMTDGGITPKEMVEMIKNDFRKTQKMLVEKTGNNKIWTFIDEGKPYETILKVAGQWEADLIVIGTHGRTGLPHVLMGSVAEKVIRHSVKPVLVIPSKKQE